MDEPNVGFLLRRTRGRGRSRGRGPVLLVMLKGALGFGSAGTKLLLLLPEMLSRLSLALRSFVRGDGGCGGELWRERIGEVGERLAASSEAQCTHNPSRATGLDQAVHDEVCSRALKTIEMISIQRLERRVSFPRPNTQYPSHCTQATLRHHEPPTECLHLLLQYRRSSEPLF